MKALIDGDLYLYRLLAATEDETDWGDDVWSLTSDIKKAKKDFKHLIKRLAEDTNSEWVTVCFSDKQNFRKKVSPDYKAARKKIRKPLGYVDMIEWCKKTFATVRLPQLEADDVMGIFATRDPKETVIISDDKDMKTIPCNLYRPLSQERMTISKQEADKNFFLQTLTGDATDGYKGIAGIGAKKAEAILGIRPHWGAVEQAYIKHGMTREDAITQARLARILRVEDWDENKNEVKLWLP